MIDALVEVVAVDVDEELPGIEIKPLRGRVRLLHPELHIASSIPLYRRCRLRAAIRRLGVRRGSGFWERPSTMTVKGRFGKYAIFQTQHQ